ncbi:hypothetical protein HS088_TW05G00280 [Tripterygium wilfordii]|uniref:Pentatricopeptide repeat-containing protein n=1 Tax=Tripterygium wilfordii TaxID=458696 RepID=A0A7J7DMG9_TRIWF|nr:hypothetical protein HS088_TW05G00280 [Tripterygium wilfordii]
MLVVVGRSSLVCRPSETVTGRQSLVADRFARERKKKSLGYYKSCAAYATTLPNFRVTVKKRGKKKRDIDSRYAKGKKLKEKEGCDSRYCSNCLLKAKDSNAIRQWDPGGAGSPDSTRRCLLPFMEISMFRLTEMASSMGQSWQLITKTYLFSDSFYAIKYIRFYAINDDIVYARNLFEKTSQWTVFLWNALIRANAQAQKFDDAMRNYDLDRLRVLHGGVTVSGLGSDSISCAALVTASSKLDLVDKASELFYGTFELDLVLWNLMICSYSYCGFGT